MDRYLAIDYGEKRCGIAVSDPLNITAQVQPYFLNQADIFEKIAALIKEKDIIMIVLGYPLSLKGEATESSRKVDVFATQLKEKLHIEIKFQDERFSTHAVEKYLIEADVSRKKRKQVIDSHAAAFFLQGFLDGL